MDKNLYKFNIAAINIRYEILECFNKLKNFDFSNKCHQFDAFYNIEKNNQLLFSISGLRIYTEDDSFKYGTFE